MLNLLIFNGFHNLNKLKFLVKDIDIIKGKLFEKKKSKLTLLVRLYQKDSIGNSSPLKKMIFERLVLKS